MKNIKITRNPFILFLPFLFFYITLIILYRNDGIVGDESRYLLYSGYMINGYLPAEEINFNYLGNGPGYSILLIPIIKLGLPLISIKVLNALLLYFSAILLFKAAMKIMSFRAALAISVFWASFINTFENVIRILPEILTPFLICVFIYSIVNVFKADKFKKYIYLAGFSLGYAALTKPIFGYVSAAMLIISCIFWFFNKSEYAYKHFIKIILIAFTVTVPYLAFTYKETGRLFYWSTLGGNNLYWATEPNEYEYGSWSPDPTLPVDSTAISMHEIGFQEQLRLNHQRDFDEINKYHGVAQDDVYKKIAIKNIKSYPVKYLKNCMSNLGRIFFNLPYSYKLQAPKTLIRFPFSLILLTLMAVCFLPTFKNWKKINPAVKFIFLFGMIYLGGSIFGSAEIRMLMVIVPAFICWTGYVFTKTFKITYKIK